MDATDRSRTLYAPTTIIITGTLFLATFLFYKWLLPKPIPGMPYNPEATKSLFGDIPSMLNHLKTHKTVSDWIGSHNTRHNSPIVQVFANLFAKPWIVISDYRETQDILMRRTKEFDKPDLISDIFFGVNPDHHTVQPTNDTYRSQRKLLQDLMAPGFLNGVAAPQLHNNFMDLIKLWKQKVRLSNGHPFSVKDDIFYTALEAIWAAVFGIEETETITRNQIELLSPMKDLSLPSSAAADDAVVFPKAPAPDHFEAVLKLTDSMEYLSKSPFPRFIGRILRWMPFVSKWIKVKNEAIAIQISKAEERMASTQGKVDKTSSAVDHMLRREVMAAERQKRAPNFHSKIMVAELFGLLVAGHDTSSTTLLWTIKFLEEHQDVQKKLRSELRSAFSNALSEGRIPTAQEISTIPVHYLDACIEEFLRCSLTANMLSRTTTTDAVVLGHVIPKGTRVLMCPDGGGVHKPPHKIDNSLRSKSYHNADGGKVGDWEIEDMDKFKPERWLVHDKTTDTKVFDSTVGPHLLFGAGPRSCFGRKLAYLELRLAIVLIVWSFELQEVPDKYTSWEAIEQLTHSPVHCYANLAEA